MSAKLFQICLLVLSLVAVGCMAPIDEDLETERTEAEPMPDVYGAVQRGQIWSSTAGTTGLGGVGQQVALGELELETPEAQMATLTLGLRSTTSNFVLTTGRVYALIKYGVGAANVEAIVDWTTCNSISLPSGKVNVTAFQVDAKGAPLLPLPTAIAGVPYTVDNTQNIGVPLILTAQLAAYERSSQGWPTVTQVLDLQVNIQTLLVAPVRAKGVIVGDSRGQAGTDITVVVQGNTGTNFYDLANAADSAIRTTGVLLGGASSISLRSVGGHLGVPVIWLLDG